MTENPRKILVIEDNDDLRTVLQDLLSLEGHATSSTSNLADARKVLDSERFDIVIVDHWLEGEASDELVEHMSRAREAPSIIMCSAAPSMVDVANRFHVYHLAKPFELDELLQLTETAAQHHRRP